MSTPQEYSRDPGRSIYPIAPGVVFCLKDPNGPKGFRLKVIANPHVENFELNHYVFLWIHTVKPIKRGIQPKHREVAYLEYLVPTNNDFREKAFDNGKGKVQFETIAKLLRPGYSKVGIAKWDSNKTASYRRFYKSIHLL